MSDAAKTNGKTTVYYDGDCAMCTALVCKIDASKRKEMFRGHDITKESLPKTLTQEDALKEIHVVDANGKMYKNADAILKILEQYPQWRWLVWIGRLPGIRRLLPVGYRIVAAHRHRLFPGKKPEK